MRAMDSTGYVFSNFIEKEIVMYSPKIEEDLIPVLYKLAKQMGKPMTRLVDEILRKELSKIRIFNKCRDTEE